MKKTMIGLSMTPWRAVSFILGCFFLVTSANAQTLPAAAPVDVGLSAERLERIDALLQADIGQGLIPGASVLVARRGKTAYFKTFGMQDKQAGIPMAKNTIFRLYSMTKPIISVAVMILHEEGRLSLTQQVAKLLPEFAETQVGVVGKDAPAGEAALSLEPVTSRMTIHHLLTHTAGFSYRFNAPKPFKDLFKQAKIGDRDRPLAEMTVKLSKLPLVYQPGTAWQYGWSHDVLGRVAEVVSGVPLDEFLAARIFRPLGMVDTGFYVPKEKLSRLAQQDPKANKKRPMLDVTTRPTLLAGGHGLVSTMTDYTRFAQMLLNGGALDGVRILSLKTVELMTADHLGPRSHRSDRSYLPGPGSGYGLGVGVRLKAGMPSHIGTAGDYYWGGAAGTYFWVDPKENLVALIMYQSRGHSSRYRPRIRRLVYQAIVD